jgi:hypothetical protein
MSESSTTSVLGPPPVGMYRCWDSFCPARRHPDTGRVMPLGKHFHSLPTAKPAMARQDRRAA